MNPCHRDQTQKISDVKSPLKQSTELLYTDGLTIKALYNWTDVSHESIRSTLVVCIKAYIHKRIRKTATIEAISYLSTHPQTNNALSSPSWTPPDGTNKSKPQKRTATSNNKKCPERSVSVVPWRLMRANQLIDRSKHTVSPSTQLLKSLSRPTERNERGGIEGTKNLAFPVGFSMSDWQVPEGRNLKDKGKRESHRPRTQTS